MFQVLEADTADALWLKATEWFVPHGAASQQSSRCGNTSEVLHASLALKNPRQRWITSRTPAMNPAFALAEVIWMVSGRNDSAFLNYFNPRLPAFAGQGATYNGAYGYRIRQQFGIDQLNRAYEALSVNPDSRQIVLQIWDSAVDLPQADGSAQSKDIPCNVTSLIKLRNGKLEWTQIMRSNDLILGLPHNIVQFSTLQEVLAGWLGVEVGSYLHYADSLHFYDQEGSVSDRIAPRSLPLNSESIALPKDESEEAFEALSALGDKLSSPDADTSEVLSEFRTVHLPSQFQSWASILTADALRRRKSFQAMEEVLQKCSNDCLTAMFERWMQRHAEK